jgi:hypothetical protein
MKECDQTKTQSVYDHGVDVWKHLEKLLNRDWDGFKIPQWLVDYQDHILTNIHDIEDLYDYAIYHDCGKPYSRVVDQHGDIHFPNHAQVSKDTWLQYSDNKIVADLIGYDMCLHVETADQIMSHDWDIKTAMSLLLTSLAEIHSNATMFGGIDTISFKSKWKKINRRGSMLVKHYFNNNKQEK